MEALKFKTKQHNEWLWDKIGRLGIDREYRSYFMDKKFIVINSGGTWHWLDKDVFKESDYKKISWKNFLRLPEPDPFKGKEYYVMATDPKEIDYLLMIAESRGRCIIGNVNKYNIRQFGFIERSNKVCGNYLERPNRGTKLTLSQFINGEWPDEFIVGEYYKGDNRIVKMIDDSDDEDYFLSEVIVSNGIDNGVGEIWSCLKICYTHLPNYKEEV